MTKENLQMVSVTWIDAYSETESWISRDDITDTPARTITVGFLITNAKKDHVVVAQSSNFFDTDEAETNFDSVMCIPVGMVERIQVLGSLSHDIPPFCVAQGADDAR